MTDKPHVLPVTDAAEIAAIQRGNETGDYALPAGMFSGGQWWADAEELKRWRQRQADSAPVGQP